MTRPTRRRRIAMVRGTRTVDRSAVSTVGSAASLLAALILGIISWQLYRGGTTPVYQAPASAADLGAVRMVSSVVPAASEVAVQFGPADSDGTRFSIQARLTLNRRQTEPPTVAFEFTGVRRIALAAPVRTYGEDWHQGQWFDEREIAGPSGERIQAVTIAAALPGPVPAMTPVSGPPVPWYTFDRQVFVVRISGWYVGPGFTDVDRSRISHAFPAVLPVAVRALSGDGRLERTQNDDRERIVATTESLALYQAGPYESVSLTTQLPPDSRIDYVFPATSDPEALTWRTEGSTDPLVVRLSLVSKRGEQLGQSNVFLAGLGLGAALTLLLMGFQFLPWARFASALGDIAVVVRQQLDASAVQPEPAVRRWGPTRPRSLWIVAVPSVALTLTLLQGASAVPDLPWLLLPIAGGIEAYLAAAMRDRMAGPTSTWPTPVTMARLVLLAKASAYLAGIFLGIYGGSALWLAFEPAPVTQPPTAAAVVVAGGLASSVVLVIAALQLERTFRHSLTGTPTARPRRLNSVPGDAGDGDRSAE